MNKHDKIIAIGCVLVFAILAVAVYAMQTRSREHDWWHECRDNCWLIDDAKRMCADQRHLTNGTVVTCRIFSRISPTRNIGMVSSILPRQEYRDVQPVGTTRLGR